MTEELYDPVETRSSADALGLLVTSLPEPVILLGGWAVHMTVDGSFREEHGATYLGSRDVDLGFHLDAGMSPDEMRATNYARAYDILQDIGYHPSGTSRFVRIIHRDTGRTLTEEEAAGYPMYDLFYLYIDPIVDHIPQGLEELIPIAPIDEPLLGLGFQNDRFTSVELPAGVVLVPDPPLLLAMKLNALPNRQKDDKRVKDACDIYAILWHSPLDLGEIIERVTREHAELVPNARGILADELAEKTAGHLGVEQGALEGVITQLLRR